MDWFDQIVFGLCLFALGRYLSIWADEHKVSLEYKLYSLEAELNELADHCNKNYLFEMRCLESKWKETSGEDIKDLLRQLKCCDDYIWGSSTRDLFNAHLNSYRSQMTRTIDSLHERLEEEYVRQAKKIEVRLSKVRKRLGITDEQQT